MSDEKATTLVAPDGQRFDAPTPTAANELRKKGFRDLNEAERKDVELQQKYGEGIAPKVGAAVSGAASALTFGGSDALLAQTPLAEANREIVDRNPKSATVGQVAALALPIAGELAGASLAGKAAQAAGAGITGVGKAATALGTGTKAVAEAVGLKGAAPILGGAATAAAEGAAFQVGTNIGAASRRDVALDAETLLAHTGEAAILGAGVGAAIPAAGKVVRWSADKALSGIERGVQGLRELGFGGAGLAVDALDAGAGAVARNADAIGAGIQGGAARAASALDNVAGGIVNNADNIGGALEGAGQKIANASDEIMLPRIRKGLNEQTGRSDIFDDVFQPGEAGRAIRKDLDSQTMTGTREVEAERLKKPLNDIWEASRSSNQMAEDMAVAVKRDIQEAELAGGIPIVAKQRKAVGREVLAEAEKALTGIAEHSPASAKEFTKAIDEFRTSIGKGSSADVYTAIDRLKSVAGELSKLEKKASISGSSSGYAAEVANNFRGYTKRLLEDENVWGKAGLVQQQVNAAVTRKINAFNKFEATFAAKAVKGQSHSVLDGAKITKYSRDITGPAGDIRNTVVDELVAAERDLVSLTERLSKDGAAQARETINSATASNAAKARAASVKERPGLADALNASRGAVDNLAGAKATATKNIDRAEVLQQTQSAILSRQGAGVNPLPVDIAQKIGGGALIGSAIGGIPGAIVGGGLSSVLQKYGAITSNPKSAIQFLNNIDRLRGVNKEEVASWIKATLGETSEQGARAGLKNLAGKVDGKALGASIRSGAEAVQGALPSARQALATANKSTAKAILEASGRAKQGLEAFATRADSATPGLMQRILPSVSYADVTNSTPQEWWKRTQKAITTAQADPQAMLDKLHKDVAGIEDALPDMAAAVTQQQLKVLGYLTDKMPRNPRPYMLGDPTQWTPDPTEMKAYRDLVLVATKPDALLPLITTGTASRAQVDAVRELWPRKFEETKKQVVDAVLSAAADGKPVPYQSRIRLGQLLQTPLDPSQESGFAQWLAGDSSKKPEEKDAAPPATVGGNLNLHSDSNLPFSARAAERK